MARKGTNPYLVKELETGFVVVGDIQYFRGYTLFLCKWHVEELHDLAMPIRLEFLREMSLVAEAVFLAFQPKKLNYELLGNREPHLHWHIFPRHTDEPTVNLNRWRIPDSFSQAYRPTEHELRQAVATLGASLDSLASR